MHSFKSDASTAAQADLDRLLDIALRLGRTHLAQASEFDPSAILISEDGRVLEAALDVSGLGKHPEPDALIENAVNGLRQVRESGRCYAIVINTRLSKERTDAIEVRLEHREGRSLVVFQRYKRATFGNRVDYGELSAFAAPRDIWF